MVVADAIGIGVGVVLNKHIPERTIKWISACIFVLFGFIGIYHILASRLDLLLTAGILACLLAGTVLAAYLILRPKRIKG